MAAGRSMKSLVGRRRRADEEGEDEEGPINVEDSQSEGSIISDLDDDEADGSSVEDANAGSANTDADLSQAKTDAALGKGKVSGKKPKKAKKKGTKKLVKEPGQEPTQSQNNGAKALADTDAMMNGLQIDDQAHEAMDFESMHQNGSAVPPTSIQQPPATNGNGHIESPNDVQKREHDDYRRKRDANPAFIPSRGNFFMHDTRMQHGRGGAPTRGVWGGRGRGRGNANVGGPFSPANQTAQAEQAAQQPWKHDLHEAINGEASRTAQQKAWHTNRDLNASARIFSRSNTFGNGQKSKVVSFSTTTKVGTIQIRVLLPRMNAPAIFSEIPWKQYTRLPDHRPPLRRDKPVRVSLPRHEERFIFPANERSFIFIPRQMRPNQQGFGRYSYQRSIGGYGYSSRRTSMYGGSMYAASVAASRRSSFASVARESAFSPVAGNGPSARPVVRLPHGQHHHYSSSNTPMGPMSGQQTPTGYQVHTFPLPQQPALQGIPSTMVHQPRPQKAISVSGIESPAVLQQTPTGQEAPPFQNQLPAHMHDQSAFGQQQPFQSPSQAYSYPPQPQAGTPLSGIPEQAVHASAFQPPHMPYGQVPYYPPYSTQGYYFPPAPNGYQSMPVYMPPPQGYMLSPPAPSASSQQAPPSQHVPQSTDNEHQAQEPQSRHQPSQSQSGMVAHESNGMVFYLPASEAQQQPHGETYQPAESFVPSYAMPGLPPTPAPDTTYYYPSQMAMPNMPPAMYYPPQPQQH